MQKAFQYKRSLNLLILKIKCYGIIYGCITPNPMDCHNYVKKSLKVFTQACKLKISYVLRVPKKASLQVCMLCVNLAIM